MMPTPSPFVPKSTKQKMGRNDPMFDNEMEEIIRERYAKGLDKKPVGRATVQRKIVKMPIWNQMKMNLKNWEFLPDAKKGQATPFLGVDAPRGTLSDIGLSSPYTNLFSIIIISFVAVVFFAGIMYVMSLVNGVMHSIPDLAINQANGSVAYVNMTTAADTTFGSMVNAMDGLRLVSMAIIFSLILGTLVMNYFIRAHPVLWVVYIFVTGLAVIFSVPVSNAYESLLRNSASPLTYYLQLHGMANYVLLHLPIFITIIGAIGGILMFANVMRAGNETAL